MGHCLIVRRNQRIEGTSDAGTSCAGTKERARVGTNTEQLFSDCHFSDHIYYLLKLMNINLCHSFLSRMLKKILLDIDLIRNTVGFREAVKGAVLAGEDIDTTEYSTWGLTALARAVMYPDIELAKFLLDRGADPEGDGKYRPMDYVTTVEMAKLLKEKGATVNYRSEVGMCNHIHQTLFNGERESGLIDFFIENGVNPWEGVGDCKILETFLTKYACDDNHKQKIAIVENLIKKRQGICVP